MTMVEAMCAGCAVITTGSGGAMEIAELAGLPLFPKEDPAELCQLLTRLATSRPWVFELAIRGQEAARKHFTWARMAAALSATLEGLAGQSDAQGGARDTAPAHERAPRPGLRG